MVVGATKGHSACLFRVKQSKKTWVLSTTAMKVSHLSNFWTFNTWQRWVVNFTPLLLYPPQGEGTPGTQRVARWVVSQRQSGHFKEETRILPKLGIVPQIVQLVCAFLLCRVMLTCWRNNFNFLCSISLHTNKQYGPGSSVGIVTGYRLDDPGIKSQWGRDFSHTSRPALGPTQPPV
jgi:hypothetical protein